MNRYELAVHEVQSVLAEWMVPLLLGSGGGEKASQEWSVDLGKVIVDRLVAKGVIQSTDPEDLVDYRTGPLEPGRKIVGGPS